MISKKFVLLEKTLCYHGIWDDVRNKAIEFLFLKNLKKRKPHGLLIFLHGHNSSAVKSLNFGLLGLKLNLDVLLISMPGYGLSKGPADYSGPQSKKRILSFLDYFFMRNHYPYRFLWGVSRGAILAPLITSQKPSLFHKLILQSGAYDFAEFYKTTKNKLLKANIRKETSVDIKAFKERSSLKLLDKYKSPLLIIHGTKDSNIPITQAQMLYKHRKKSGLPVLMKIFPDEEHQISILKIESLLKEFLHTG